jgi:hypothetical protein
VKGLQSGQLKKPKTARGQEGGLAPAVLPLSEKQPDQFAYARQMVIVMLSLKEQHVYQPHRHVKPRMKCNCGKRRRRKTVQA